MTKAYIHSFFQYLALEKRYSPLTIDLYKTDLHQFIDYLTSQFELESEKAKHEHIRSWSVFLMEKGISSRSIRRKLSVLKTYYKFLRKKGIVAESPMLKVLAPKAGKVLPTVMEQKTLQHLFENVPFGDDFKGKRDQLMVELLYGTGMRRAELIGLKLDSIDLDGQRLKVLGKGNKERLLPLSPYLVKLMQQYLSLRGDTFPQSESYLFLTNKGKKLYPKLVYNTVHHYLSLVSTLEKRSPHVLRHSFATHMIDNGADLQAVKELLGHASLAATQVYTHNSIKRLQEVYQQAHPKATSSTAN